MIKVIRICRRIFIRRKLKMTLHNTQILKGARSLGAVIGISFLALTACAQMTQPTATAKPAKAYVGVFKDNVVAVVVTQTNSVLRTIQITAGLPSLVVTHDVRMVYC